MAVCNEQQSGPGTAEADREERAAAGTAEADREERAAAGTAETDRMERAAAGTAETEELYPARADSTEPDSITPDRKEILRYLGYRGQTPDAVSAALIDSCVEDLRRVIQPRSYTRIFPIAWGARTAEDCVEIGIADMTIRSRSLTRNLKGCTRAALMAATIGIGPDRLIRRAEIANMAKAAVYQAASAAMVEAWCNQVNQRIAEEAYRKEGLYCRPRFSPGYGDVPLAHQKDFDRILELQKHVGIVLGTSLLMTPSKSVTVVIGMSPVGSSCVLAGCEECTLRETCEFSRTQI